VSEDGWYADPTGRSSQRLYLAGTWTRRVRSAEGVEATEGEDHSGAMAEALTPRPARGWTAERPSFGLATAAVGGVLAVLGFTVLDWAAAMSFADLRRTVAADPGQFDVVTQAYTKFVFLPLLVVVLVSGLLTTVGRTLARIAVALAGVVGGVGLVGVVIWIEGGGAGTDQSRGDAVPVLTVMVAVGIVAAALGVGAYFDESAMLARGLAGTLAGLAVILHVYVVTDVFDGTSGSALGAWAPAIGYGLLTVAPALPYRRVLHT
jgi:hypothetical protein